MGLKILRESDPISVSQLVVCIHSLPGNGKTSMGFTAEKPLLIDFDKGAYRSQNRRDSVPVSNWDDVSDPTREDFTDRKTVVVDTAGRALDWLSASIIRDEPKLGKGGTLSIQGYGVLKSRFLGWLNLVKSFGHDVVLLVHSEEKSSGDKVVERLDVQGGSKNEIYKSADVMGRLYFDPDTGKRMLSFSPSETSFGKNPAQLPPMEVPDFGEEPNFLAGVIQQTKDFINRQTEAQRETVEYLDTWRAAIDEAKEPEAFDKLLASVNKATCSDAVRTILKRLLKTAGDAQAIAFDSKAKGFVRKAA